MPYRIDTAIPSGNACDVEVTGSADGVPVVSFAADPHGGPECLWFCFRLKRAAQDAAPAPAPAAAGGPARLKLVLKHLGNMLGGSDPGAVMPVMRLPGADWERLGGGEREELPDGRVCASWTVDAPEEHADVAFSYPYGGPELDELLAGSRGYWRADVIGVSQGALPILRLSNSSGAASADEPKRPGVYLAARQHSGETPGSWVLDGFLREMPKLGPRAPLIWAAPLANIDGVEGGDYGKDNFPYDLNRAWGSPPMRHETLVLQRDMRRWAERCEPRLALDLHAPGGCETDGVYAFLTPPDASEELHSASSGWAELFAEALRPEYAAEEFGRVADYPSRWETPCFAAFASGAFGAAALTLETPYALCGATVMTRERYREAGARVARAVAARLAE